MLSCSKLVRMYTNDEGCLLLLSTTRDSSQSAYSAVKTSRFLQRRDFRKSKTRFFKKIANIVGEKKHTTFFGLFVCSNPRGVQMSDDARGKYKVVCPLPMAGFRWCEALI